MQDLQKAKPVVHDKKKEHSVLFIAIILTMCTHLYRKQEYFCLLSHLFCASVVPPS